MKVGDKFSSYEEFSNLLTVYKKSINNEFWIRDARTIENQRKRAPESVENINESLRYYHLRLACVKGGRAFKSRNVNSKRKCTTYKEDCEATIFVRVSACKQYLCVLELKDNHNHTSSKTYFTTLSQQRLQLSESVKNRVRESLRAGANKKVLLNKIRTETGRQITLKDLTNINRKTKKKNFQECVNMLKNTYNCCDVQLLVDEGEVFKGLFFQDERMKKYMDAFPEILFIDSTYCLVDLKTATYIIMIEDGSGLSEIVAVCLLVDEDEQSINYFIEAFKNRNPAWKNVQVVMSDKNKTERKIFKKHFPDAKLMMCLFHVFQIFNREVTCKKMDLTAEEVKISKEYLQKLVYSLSESDYRKIYDEMATNVPQIVKNYYDSNWACITDQWVQYLTLQNLCFTNKINNRLESVNNKLKTAIKQYSPMQDIIKHLFAYINSVRIGKDVKNSQMLNRKLAKPYEKNSTEYLYREHLTTFAFEKVEKQLNFFKTSKYKEFRSIGNNAYMAVTSEGLIQVTPLSCECLFRKSTQLPCAHIFNCRSKLSMSLFDVNLCLNRWSRSYCEKILEEFDNNKSNRELESKNTPEKVNDIQIAQLKATPKYMTNQTKFKLMNEEGKKMAELCSEVSTSIFCERLKLIKNIIKHWEAGQDETLMNLLKDNFSETSTNCHEQEIQPNRDGTENEALHDNATPTRCISQIQSERITNISINSTDKFESENITENVAEINEIMDVSYENVLHPSDVLQIEIDTSHHENATNFHSKMPIKIKKRGRPKVYGNTVIGPKRKRRKNK